MSWVRLDDGFHSHPKIVALENPRDPLNVWVRVLSWCGEYSPSGHIPSSVAKKFAHASAIRKLVEQTLWDECADGDGFTIHDFHIYASKPTIVSEVDPSLSAKRADAGRKGGLARSKGRVTFEGISKDEKLAANRAVNAAIRRGQMHPELCNVCGAKSAQAHHDDYRKPLDVVWLCRIHHEERHRLLLQANQQTCSEQNGKDG